MRKLLLAATLLTAPLVYSSAAHAGMISVGLQQSGVNGGAVTTVDTSSTGSIVYSGSYGSFTVNNITAVGSPSLTAPDFDTSSLNVSSAAGGTLNVFITEQGLTSPLGITNILSSFTSNLFSGAVTSVTEKTFISTSNATYGGTLIASHTFSGINTATVVTPVNLTSPYSETVEYTIRTTGSANVNDTINIATAVPEPASLALLGMGLFGLGMVRRRKSKG